MDSNPEFAVHGVMGPQLSWIYHKILNRLKSTETPPAIGLHYPPVSVHNSVLSIYRGNNTKNHTPLREQYRQAHDDARYAHPWAQTLSCGHERHAWHLAKPVVAYRRTPCMLEGINCSPNLTYPRCLPEQTFKPAVIQPDLSGRVGMQQLSQGSTADSWYINMICRVRTAHAPDSNRQ